MLHQTPPHRDKDFDFPLLFYLFFFLSLTHKFDNSSSQKQLKFTSNPRIPIYSSSKYSSKLLIFYHILEESFDFYNAWNSNKKFTLFLILWAFDRFGKCEKRETMCINWNGDLWRWGDEKFRDFEGFLFYKLSRLNHESLTKKKKGSIFFLSLSVSSTRGSFSLLNCVCLWNIRVLYATSSTENLRDRDCSIFCLFLVLAVALFLRLAPPSVAYVIKEMISCITDHDVTKLSSIKFNPLIMIINLVLLGISLKKSKKLAL